jgi:hypothetical protein
MVLLLLGAVAAGDQAADVASTQKPSFPTRWRSLTSGTTKNIRIDGDTVHVETVLPEEQRRAGAFQVAELHKVGDKYVGERRGAFFCGYVGHAPFTGREQKVNRCAETGPMELTVLTPTRIEGSFEAYSLKAKFDCGKCQWKGEIVRQTFTWIPK